MIFNKYLPGVSFNAAITSADTYIMSFSVNKIPYPLWLVESFTVSGSKDSENIYVMGSDEPVDIKTSHSKYSGSITLEAFVLEAIMIANLYSSPTQITGATISIIAATTGVISRLYKNVHITGFDQTTKAKDKRSLITLKFEATEI
jgi:hypothetical protein